MSEDAARPTRSPTTSVSTLLARRGVRWGIAAAAFLAVTCIYFAPLIGHLDSRVLGTFGDATQAIRTYDVMAREGKNPFTFVRDPLNGAPEGMPVLAQPQIAQPVQSVAIWVLRDVVGTVAALNLFFLAGFVLTSFAVFVLLDWARFGMLPSLFGGFVVAFNPWMVERAIAGHVAFMHGWALVLLLAALTKLRGTRTLKWGALAGLAYGLCFLVAAYMGLLATALVVAFVIVDLLSQKSRAERLWTCTLVLVMGCATMVLLLPGVIALALDHGTIAAGLSNATRALQTGGARPDEYLLPVPRHPVLGIAGDLRRDDVFHERYVFVGYVVLVLAAITAVQLVRRRTNLPRGVAQNLVVLAAVAIPVAFVASMPRQLTVLGVGLPMPSYVFGEITTFFRVYARLGFVVEMGLAVLAVVALDQMFRRSRRQVALALLLVAITVFEFLPGTLSTAAVGKAPAYDTWLARQTPGIAAHYPMITDTRQAALLAASELYYQRFTDQPLYEIYGPERRGTREDAIRLLSRYVDQPNSLGILSAVGVRYVVIHDDVYRAQGEEPPSIGSGARLLRTFGPVRVYRLTAEPIDLTRYLADQAATIADLFGLVRPSVSYVDGFYAPEAYQSYTVPFQWMGTSGEIEILNEEATAVRIWLEALGFSNSVERRLVLLEDTGRRVSATSVPTYLVSIRLGPFDVPPGRSRFSLRVVPSAAQLGPGDGRIASVFLSDMRAIRHPDLSRTLRASASEQPP
jgi:hypothetical protein